MDQAGRKEEAEALYRRSMALAERTLDAGQPQLASLKANLGKLLFEKGEADEAEVLLADAYARRLKRFGPSHPETLTNARNLAVLYTIQAKTNPARFDDAERLMRAALDGNVARFGAEITARPSACAPNTPRCCATAAAMPRPIANLPRPGRWPSACWRPATTIACVCL